MNIKYLGQKNDFELALPWMEKPVKFTLGCSSEVCDQDAHRLLSEFPQSFCEGKQVKEQKGATLQIEGVDGKYHCPYCDKTYHANKQGFGYLKSHIEKEHS